MLAACCLCIGKWFSKGFSLEKGFNLCIAVVNSFIYCFSRVKALVACWLLSGFLEAFPRVFDLKRHCEPT